MTREELIASYDSGNRDFVGKDLRDLDLSGLDLSGANFRGADLQDTNLWGSSFRGVNFRGVNLRGACLRDACLRDADLRDAYLRGVDLRGADLRGADLQRIDLSAALLDGVIGFRYDDAPDPMVLRKLVADQIEAHPDLHDQESWGDGTCGTPCCVAGWACLLGGGRRNDHVSLAALRLLWVDGLPMPSFDALARREDIVKALRVTPCI
jgi:uncharacterized protein YjbI with pentapeptide repeats